MFDTIGERITFCRGLLGMTREVFIQEFKVITLSTLARWELNSINIPEQKLLILIKFFNDNGVIVKSEWLRYGEGMHPINIMNKNISVLNFDETVYTTMNSLSQKVSNFVLYQISNNFFEPILKYGDYVGGAIHQGDIDSMHSKLCFIKTDHELLVGIFNFKNKTIENSNNVKNIKITSDLIIGEATWIIRRT